MEYLQNIKRGKPFTYKGRLYLKVSAYPSKHNVLRLQDAKLVTIKPSTRVEKVFLKVWHGPMLG